MPNRPIPTEEDRNDPVYYCRHCHSLYVLTDEELADDKWDGSYCGKCHSTNIGICAFGEWWDEEERRRLKREELEWSR